MNDEQKKIEETRKQAYFRYVRSTRRISSRYVENLKQRKKLKTMNKIISVLWIIFVGIWNSILTIVLGISQCLSIIGIPLGIICFKSVKLIFSPINKRVELNFGKHPILNIIWLIFGGLGISLYYFIQGVALFFTIIFADLAINSFKFAKFYLAPFGAKIVNKYEFETEEDKIIMYSYQHKKRKETTEQQEEIKTLNNIEDIKLFLKQNLIFYNKRIRKIYLLFFSFAVFLIIIFGIFIYKLDDYFTVEQLVLENILLGVGFYVVLMLVILVFLPLAEKILIIENSIYGYMPTEHAIIYLKSMNKETRKECLEYYNSNKEEIDELINQEYLY